MSLRVYYFQVDYIWVLYIPIIRTGFTAVNSLFYFHVDEVACQNPTWLVAEGACANSGGFEGWSMASENGRSLVMGNSPQVDKETSCEPVETFT